MRHLAFASAIIALAGCTSDPSGEGSPKAISTACATDGDCIHTGCSGEICASEEVFTICIAKCEYNCYAQASCGCVSGQCRFGHDPTLARCLAGCSGGNAPTSPPGSAAAPEPAPPGPPRE